MKAVLTKTATLFLGSYIIVWYRKHKIWRYSFSLQRF